MRLEIGHNPTMQFFTGISRNTQSMISWFLLSVSGTSNIMHCGTLIVWNFTNFPGFGVWGKNNIILSYHIPQVLAVWVLVAPIACFTPSLPVAHILVSAPQPLSEDMLLHTLIINLSIKIIQEKVSIHVR